MQRKTGRENLSEALILQTRTWLLEYFPYLHGMEMGSRNPVWENGYSSTFSSRPNHTFILTTAEHNRTLLRPHHAADYKHYNQRLFLPLYQLLHCLFTELWHQKTSKTICTKDNHTEANFTPRNRLQVVGGGQQAPGEGTRKSVGPSKPLLAFMFTAGTLPYPPANAHPLQSTQVSSAL